MAPARTGARGWKVMMMMMMRRRRKRRRNRRRNKSDMISRVVQFHGG
jgi:hypothetical protein